MTYTISKDFTFEASHQLLTLPAGHKCSRLHGHSYRVRVELAAATLDEHGFVVDFGDLAPFGKWIDENLDHEHLNDVMVRTPTSEHLARWLADVLAEELGENFRRVDIAGLGVSETPKTWAWWRP